MAGSASLEAHEGRIYLPEQACWLDALEAELFAWQGLLPHEQVDQIDTLSYAARARVEGICGDVAWEGAWLGPRRLPGWGFG